MSMKNVILWGGALYLVLYVYRNQAKASQNQQQTISAFQASRM